MEISIKRHLEAVLKSNIGKNKVLLVFGTRRVGKTWLIEDLLNNEDRPKLLLNGEDQDVQALLANRSKANYARILGDTTLLAIDEAQAIPEIGKVLKLMIDSFKQLTIIASGSSAFDLSNQTGEPLTGRSLT